MHKGKPLIFAYYCRQLYFVLSGVCLLIGVTTTHGLGGQLRHASALEAGEEISQQWRFFQPFQCAPYPALRHCSITAHLCCPVLYASPLQCPSRPTSSPCTALLQHRTAVASRAVPL